MNAYGYHPTTITHYALAHWNLYLTTLEESHLHTFLKQAQWLVEHEVIIDEGMSGWPLSFSHPDVPTNGSWLSALTQGCGISVLVRAYKLTEDARYLEVAHRVIGTFKRDILDGGVSTPVDGEGVFFEEVAVYPAAHMLSGFMFALLGLYDYVMVTDNTEVSEIIRHALATMHWLLVEFDTGFWLRNDLLGRQLASSAQLTLHIELLSTLATCSGCSHCAILGFALERVSRKRCCTAALFHSQSLYIFLPGSVKTSAFCTLPCITHFTTSTCLYSASIISFYWRYLDSPGGNFPGNQGQVGNRVSGSTCWTKTREVLDTSIQYGENGTLVFPSRLALLRGRFSKACLTAATWSWLSCSSPSRRCLYCYVCSTGWKTDGYTGSLH